MEYSEIFEIFENHKKLPNEIVRFLVRLNNIFFLFNKIFRKILPRKWNRKEFPFRLLDWEHVEIISDNEFAELIRKIRKGRSF